MLRDLDIIISNPEKYARNVTVKKLVSVLKKMSERYYHTGQPYVGDAIYDVLLDVLKERDPNNAFLYQIGVDPSAKDAVNLPFSMPSLNKIKPGEKSFEKWFNKYKGPYMISDKLDGVSAQLYKDEKGDVKLYTRGNATTGRNITHLLNFLVGKNILNVLPVNTSIRGEILINKEDFEGLKDEYKNPRNTVSGIVNGDKIDTRIVKNMQLVIYSIIYPRYNFSRQMKILKKWGFKIVWNKKLEIGDDDGIRIKQLEKKLEDILVNRKINSEFDVDGIVVTDDSKTYLHTDTNPPYSMAFKMNIATNMKNVVVDDVLWEPTMYGYLQPILKIKPTELSGTTITYVTAHNAKYVSDNKIGKGSIIKIVRSGDVIPYVTEIIKSNDEPDMPNMGYEWTDTNVDIIASNPSPETVRLIKIKQILHFFRVLKVKFLSIGLVTKLYDAGYDSIVSIANAGYEKDKSMYNVSGLGKKMVDKIYDQIDKAFLKIKLPELMAGSLKFGRGMGVKKIKEVILKYPDILEYPDEDEEDEEDDEDEDEDDDYIRNKLLEVSGFSDKSAEKFSKGLRAFKVFLQELRENTGYDLDFKVHTKMMGNNDMSDQIVVLTGFRDQRITDYIENHGGLVTNSVSKKTTLIIYVPMDKHSSKLEKGKLLGIPTITKNKFIKIYNII